MSCAIRAHETADDSAPVAAVSAGSGIGQNSGVQVIVIFPSEVECCRESLVDVTGGAQNLANDHAVGPRLPAGGFSRGEPIARRRHESFAESCAL